MSASANERIGVLLVNLGTPEAPTARALRPYLRQFLSDPRVIDISALGRWLLVNLVIVPFRSPKSAEAYREVWMEEGSPLLVHSRNLERGLSDALPSIPVELGMRYGQPSISSAVERLVDAGADRFVVLPLFPQYSSAAWGSAMEEIQRVTGALPFVPALSVIPPFFEDPTFIAAQAETVRETMAEVKPDLVLMSYHGIPERHCRATDFSGSHCFAAQDCCSEIVAANRACYRAQCFASSRALAADLGLKDDAYEVSFQSRLGRTPWIQPFTDEVVTELPKRGVKRLVVTCPSFTADCLETIEEIGMRAREDFLAAGGEAFALAPCVNASATWIEGCRELVRRHSMTGAASGLE